MLKVSQLTRVHLYKPKKGRADADLAHLSEKDLLLVGTVRQVVFAPEGDRAVGLLLRRPDVAGMVKREDAFVALDSFAVNDVGLVVSRDDAGMDQAAIERLGLDWDACILWTGMDAKTLDGTVLGWVNDVEFSPKTGNVKAFYIGDGAVAKSLVGNMVVPADLLRGYANGYLLLDPKAAKLSLDGGLAAKAGEGYARAKHGGKQAVSKATTTGARNVGRMIGKAKKHAGGSPKGMFSSFMDEYRKASK